MTDVRVELFYQSREKMGTIGAYWCTFDESILCERCRPEPAPGDVDLRAGESEQVYRVVVTHRRRPVQRVIWIEGKEVMDLEFILLGHRDRQYFNPQPAGDPGSLRARYQAWWREFREEIEGLEPDLGEELGVYPRCLDFGELGAEPVPRMVHLLNPTGRSAVFEFQGNLLTRHPGRDPGPGQYPYRMALTPTVEAARRGPNSFEVPAEAQLVVEVLAQPWARRNEFQQFEIWVTPEGDAQKYIGLVDIAHQP